MANERDRLSTVPAPTGFGAGSLFLAFLTGAAAGAAAAYLTAPQSGERTRTRIGELARTPQELLARVPVAFHEASEAFTVAMKDGAAPHAEPRS